MQDLKRYKGCKAIIRDDGSGKIIAETNIIDCDNKKQSVNLDSRYFENYSYDRISMLILFKTSIYECKGNVRKVSGSRYTEIALYHGHEKEDDRTTKRYEVNTPARIENFIISKHICHLPHPLEVIVKNISADGVLLEAAVGLLNIDVVFQLRLMISGSETIINSTVIRINNINYDIAEYGCHFNYLYE